MDANVAKKVAQFFSKYTARSYGRGHTLVLADLEPEGIWHLERGEVRQYDIAPNGDTIVLNVFKPPAFFPMAWAVNKTPNRYFFDALTDITVRTAPAQEVVAFLQANPDVLFDLLSRVYRGVEGVLGRMARMMQNSARNRILYELVISCERSPKPHDDTYHLSLHETDLGSRIGLTRETVNREMRALKEDGLISITPQGLVVHNLATLKKRLLTDPA